LCPASSGAEQMLSGWHCTGHVPNFQKKKQGMSVFCCDFQATTTTNSLDGKILWAQFHMRWKTV
jgi:hypothetical protein